MPKRSRAARGQQKQQQHRAVSSAVPNAFVTPRLSATLDTVDAESTTAFEFYSRYIATRCPCLITPPSLRSSSSSPSSGWSSGWATQQWSNAYLKQTAGDCVVQAEQRGEKDAGFGSGRRISLPFRELVAAFDSGKTDLYMTTQYPDDSGASPSPSSASAASFVSADIRYLVAPPLTALLPDFPLLPALLSTLVPHQYNLWFGHSSLPTTSRLHHDYHDNLYCLLRGSKTFTLISPAYALQLRTVGRMAEVRRNGLIVYEGDAEVHDDGSTESERLDVRKEMLEDRIAQLEAEVEQLGSESAGSRTAAVRAELDKAEEAMEELLEQTLTLTAEDEDEAEDGTDEEVEEAEQDDIDAEELAAWQRWMKPSKRQPATRSLPAKRSHSHARGGLADDDTSSPPNFSELSTASLPASIPRLTVRLSAPSLLYLPAGWFHEVFSESSGSGGHLALNYWLRPPDVLQQRDGEKDREEKKAAEAATSSSPFSRAYSAHELWAYRWERQRQQLERERESIRQRRQQQQQLRQSEDDSTAAASPRRGMFGQRGWRSMS